MYQRKQQISTIRRQWRYLSSRLKQWVEDGSFATFTPAKQAKLRNKLRQLLSRMVRWENTRSLRKALGGAVLLLGLSAAPAQAQVTFGPVQENPFGLMTREDLSFDVFADIDGDGDLDIISTAYAEDNIQKLQFRENQSTDGGATALFAAEQDFFGATLPMTEDGVFLRPELADIDDDGDLDLFVGFYDYYNTDQVYYFPNEGTAQAPVFGNIQNNPFGMDFGGSNLSTPNLADMDGDGDLDMLSSFYSFDDVTYEYEFGIVYQENIGSAAAPMFDTAVREAFGLPTSFENITFFELGDIDNDGDLDILSGDTNYDYDTYMTDYKFYENIGDATNPAFAEVVLNPFGLASQSSFFLWPLLGDLDNDGDLDVLNSIAYDVETYGVNWTYQENLLLDVGLENLVDEFTEVAIFPTVSTGTFNLQIRTEASPLAVTLSVFNTQGQLLQQQSYPATTQLDEQLNLQAYPAGTYHVNLQNGAKQWTGTVVKQ